jgi:hypothetical protein
VETAQAASNKDALRSMLFICSSFVLAYCLQAAVHESGHYLAGWAVGAQGGRIDLHPFLNSKVTFTSVPSVSAQVTIGLMGVIADMVLATTFAALAWRRKSSLTLPLLMWGAIAFIGEGIGMLGNIAALPHSFDDVGQLMLLDISPKPLIPLSIAFVVAGLILMSMIMPISGVSPKDSFLKKLIAFFCGLPLYFAVVVLCLRVLYPQEADVRDVRMKQFLIGVVLAALLAVGYQPMDRLLRRVIRTKEVSQPKRREIMYAAGGAILAFVFLMVAH